MGQVEDGADVRVRQAVVGALTLAACGDEPTPAEARQVVRDPRLLHAQRVAQLVDTQLSLAELFQNSQTHRIVQTAEPLGQKIEVVNLLALLDEDFGSCH